jgi:hypothetical protein
MEKMINEKKKKEIGEKAKEWEMKGQGCLAFPLPSALPISSCKSTHKGSFSQEVRIQRRDLTM